MLLAEVGAVERELHQLTRAVERRKQILAPISSKRLPSEIAYFESHSESGSPNTRTIKQTHEPGCLPVPGLKYRVDKSKREISFRSSPHCKNTETPRHADTNVRALRILYFYEQKSRDTITNTADYKTQNRYDSKSTEENKTQMIQIYKTQQDVQAETSPMNIYRYVMNRENEEQKETRQHVDLEA